MSAVDETEIMEMAGVFATAGEDCRYVRFREWKNGVYIDKIEANNIVLTPAQARRLAEMLDRLAARVERRLAKGQE